MEQFNMRRIPSAEYILHLKYTGYFGPHNADDWFKSIISLYDNRVHNALLLDVSELAVEVELLRPEDGVAMWERHNLAKIPRIAFFSDKHYLKIDSKYEKASRERGINMRFFWDAISDAVDWLREDQ